MGAPLSHCLLMLLKHFLHLTRECDLFFDVLKFCLLKHLKIAPALGEEFSDEVLSNRVLVGLCIGPCRPGNRVPHTRQLLSREIDFSHYL